MCGRYSLTPTAAEIAARFSADLSGIAFRPRYNLAPGQEAPVVIAEGGTRRMKTMLWGLVPHWARDPRMGYQMINARAESVATKPAFREALGRRRCLVPADGFFEWIKKPGEPGKTPFRFVLENEKVFAFAGLWDHWEAPQGGTLLTFTIITTQANELVSKVHDRMPVILTREEEETWLDPTLSDLVALLRPAPASRMKAYEVSPIVNSTKNDAPECVSPVGTAPEK